MEEEDLMTLIQVLPTPDIEALIHRVEDAHHKGPQAVHMEIQLLSDRLTVDETATYALEQRVTSLERDRTSQVEIAVALQLQMEDLEDRSRRNNLRLRGLP